MFWFQCGRPHRRGHRRRRRRHCPAAAVSRKAPAHRAPRTTFQAPAPHYYYRTCTYIHIYLASTRARIAKARQRERRAGTTKGKPTPLIFARACLLVTPPSQNVVIWPACPRGRGAAGACFFGWPSPVGEGAGARREIAPRFSKPPLSSPQHAKTKKTGERPLMRRDRGGQRCVCASSAFADPVAPPGGPRGRANRRRVSDTIHTLSHHHPCPPCSLLAPDAPLQTIASR